MKKYSVYIKFKNGEDYKFNTNTNVLLLQPMHSKGTEMIVTKDHYGVNLVKVKKLEVIEIGHGKIGEIIR